jgi:hypothetical protein
LHKCITRQFQVDKGENHKMKKAPMFTAFVCAVILLGAALDSFAATARVRCEVETDRLRIKVDGQDLSKGTYSAKVKNARTGGVVNTAANKVQTVTVGPGDVDLDFDSTAQANDSDTFVPKSFAKVGDTVRASVINVKTGVTVSAASTSCRAK